MSRQLDRCFYAGVSSHRNGQNLLVRLANKNLLGTHPLFDRQSPEFIDDAPHVKAIDLERVHVIVEIGSQPLFVELEILSEWIGYRSPESMHLRSGICFRFILGIFHPETSWLGVAVRSMGNPIPAQSPVR